MTYKLTPVKDVMVIDNYFVAASDEPILKLHGPLPKPGTWFEIQYKASYLDHLARPLIYFEGTDEWEVMQAPYFGKGSWVGYYPKSAKGILISPTNRTGNFRFVVNDLRNVFLPKLYIRAFIQNPKTALMSIGAGIIGTDKGMRQALMFARGGYPLTKYHKWRKRMLRPYDKNGIDAPYYKTCEHTHLRIVAEGETELSIINSSLWKSLTTQHSQDYSIVFRDTYGSLRLIYSDPKKPSNYATQILSSEIDGLSEDDLLTVVSLETIFHSYSIDCLINTSSNSPQSDIFYADHDELNGSFFVNPSLLPDWSPSLQREAKYIKGPIFFKIHKIKKLIKSTDYKNINDLMLSQLHKSRPHHIRRVLISNILSLPSQKAHQRTKKCIEPREPINSKIRVSVIIPSKDNIDLIKNCITSLLKFSNPLPSEIIIIDNNSNIKTLNFYSSLDITNLKIIQFKEAFNFSAMCNIGAQAASGEILIFMNNDVECLNDLWLSPLINIAMFKDIGVVAPLLLFPNSSIQHAGIVIGMGGFGDHIFQSEPAYYKGYLDKLTGAHEVSAVTGALMVIERDKFLKIGGFNDIDYPIELNDVDICLRLNEGGLHTIVLPIIKLYHRQSTTRGFHFKPFETYRLERYNFKKNWKKYIRDDPYYHPALSLYSIKLSLDF